MIYLIGGVRIAKEKENEKKAIDELGHFEGKKCPITLLGDELI